jgi:hypothetical protein
MSANIPMPFPDAVPRCPKSGVNTFYFVPYSACLNFYALLSSWHELKSGLDASGDPGAVITCFVQGGAGAPECAPGQCQ